MEILFLLAAVLLLSRLAFADAEVRLVESSHRGSQDQLFDTIILLIIL